MKVSSIFILLGLFSPLVVAQTAEERSSNEKWLGEHDGGQMTVISSTQERVLPTTKPNEKGGVVNNFRVGFVNFRRIMASVPQLDDIRTHLDHEFGGEEKSLLAVQQELAMAEQKLAKMERGEAYSAYEKQVIAKRREVARRDAAFRDSFSIRRNEELAKLQKLIADEILELAKTQGYDIILNDTGVFYVGKRADLSSVVISRLIEKAKEEQP